MFSPVNINPAGFNHTLLTTTAPTAIAPTSFASTDLEEAVSVGLSQSTDYQLLIRTFGITQGDEKVSISEKGQTDLKAEYEEIVANVAASVAELEASISEVTELRIESRSLSVSSQAQVTDPLAFDLDGDGLETTGIEQGVLFDIDADGKLDKTSFTTGGDAFLALDRNNNGAIDNGRELFGDQGGFSNGFEALAALDDNHDGVINREDDTYSQLELFSIDASGQTIRQSLASAGISEINLNYRSTNTALNTYDSIAQLGEFTREDGSKGTVGDLLLGHVPV